MSGVGSKVADVLHKTVSTGLIVLTVAGLVDVTRGFSVLAKKNMDRRAATENATTQAPVSSTQEE